MTEKQAKDVCILDLRELSQAVVDYFVICSAENEPQIDAITQHIQNKTRTLYNERSWFVEGIASQHWVLLDYVHVVAHVFTSHQRQRYALEELWGDAQMLSVSS